VAEKPNRKTTRPPPKRQWQRPRVKTGQLFESNSLACGKNAPINDECGIQNPLQS
jgi:hypothetical protein